MNHSKGFLFLLCFFLLPEVANSFSRSWYQKAHAGGDARHRCTAFSIGNKGYYGGGHINSGITITYKDYWEYDPATNSWTQIADYGGGLRYHASAFTIGNAAYVGCGENGSHSYTNDFWKYVPEVNTWFPVAGLPAIERRGGVAFEIDGIGYYGTGQSDEGYHTDFYAYDPESDSWSALTDFPGEPRSAAVCFAHGGKGYVGTGHITGAAVSDFYEYDPETDAWQEKATAGGSVRQDAMAFTIDGKGYIGTGNDNLGNDFKDIWEYDFDTDTWTQTEDFAGESRRYATTFVIDNIVYLTGGTDGTNFKDCWAYAPTVSIAENQPEPAAIKLYPNPSTDQIQISTSLSPAIMSKVNIVITTMSGQIVQEIRQPQAQFSIEKETIGTGQFMIQFFYKDQRYNTQKIRFI